MYRSMWAIAASRSATTATDILRSRNSVAKSSSVAAAISGRRRRVPASPTSSTPSRARAIRGRNSSATASCTSRVSIALHTLGRWIFALRTIRSAMSRSADASTIDVAVPVAVDDERDRRVLEDQRDQPLPPRGTRRSIVPRSRTNSATVSRATSATRTTAVLRECRLLAPPRERAGDRDVRRDAPADPRSSAAFPDLRHSAAASEVTFGRFS